MSLKTSRRRFLQMVLTSAGAALLPRGTAWAGTGKKSGPAFPDLVAVKDGSPVKMFEAGIRALGGMTRFVKKGQTVLVKPNIGWNKTPNEAANTNPELTGRVVASAYEAGAKKVYVFDHSVNVEKECHRRSGIAKAVKDNGGIMRTAEKEKDYREAAIPGAKRLKKVQVHKLYLDSDVVIDLPVLKSHGGGRATAALKNLMGVVWDRGYYHRRGLHRCIAEFPRLRKPDLSIVDAYVVMMKNGPRGVSSDDLLLKRMQLLSTDPVLVDAAGAKILGFEPEDVAYLPLARDFGIGSMDLAKSAIKKISIKA